MPGHWKLRRKSDFHKENIHRSKSDKEVPHGLQKRRRTVPGTTETRARRCKSVTMLNSTKESPEHLYATGRHFMRRPALFLGSDQNLHSTNVENHAEISINFVTICLEDGNASFKKTVAIEEDKTLEELLVLTFHKQGIVEDDLSVYHITCCKGGVYSSIDMKAPALEYLASVIEIQPLKSKIEKNNISAPDDELSIASCLKYFETNGFVEIPSNNRMEEEDSFHLPRVTPLDPIESSWEDLDIHMHLKKSLSPKEQAQQQALWELIATEHSFLRQLETVINLFMRSLELIRRTGLLTEVNYHNVFGYMEEIYLAHEQFWYWTLYPCLEKVRNECCPLDLHEIVLRFPTEFSTDFEVYEQHCAFESTNLRSLDEAVDQADFRSYLEWCESQPQCERLRLKDFLAKPMQRLTKYSLLFKAILFKTTDEAQVEELEQMIDEISTFVTSVNGVLRAQEETALVEKTMKKIVGYSPVEIPSEFKELVQPYSHLDLLAPMPDVDITKPRILIVEGKFRYRDNHTRMVAHVILFSDMLLITKTLRGTDRYTVVRPPFKISQLQVHLKESGNILCVVLNDFNVLSDIFTLKAHSYDVAQEWVDNITTAQEFYSSAMEHKAQSWRILESLRQERVLHGISQDLLGGSENQLLNGHRWSIQSVSGSPILSRLGSSMEFCRVPSGESTSSSVFPSESQTPRQEPARRNTLPARTISLNRPSMLEVGSVSNMRTASSPSPDSQLLTPQNSPAVSPAAQRPLWQRAHSLTTLLSHHHGEYSLSEFTKTKRLSVQLTLKDATTQTENECLSDRISSLDEDTTDEGELTPPPFKSPTTPINIIVSGIPTVKRHHRSKSDCLPSPQHNALEDPESSPNFDRKLQNRTFDSPSHAKEKRLRRSVCIDDEWDDTNTAGLQKSNTSDNLYYKDHQGKLNVTLPSNFRFPTNDSRVKLHRHSTSQLSKIYESTDEESDENEDGNGSAFFSRDSNLRRSKSSFELSYGGRSLLKPPSPLTTHLHRSRERLNALTSPVLNHTTNHSTLSPTLPSRELLFMGTSLEEDEDSEWQKNTRRMSQKNLLKQQGSKERTDKSQDHRPKEEKHKWWSGKSHVKSAGTGRSKRSLFGLFRGRAMSVDGINHIPPLKFNATSSKLWRDERGLSPPKSPESPKSPEKTTLGSSSPRKSPSKSAKKSPSKTQAKPPKQSPARSPEKTTLGSSSPRKSPSKSAKRSPSKMPANSPKQSPATSPCRSPDQKQSSPIVARSQQQLAIADNQAQRNVRMSLNLTQPDHTVVFLSNIGRSKSLPSSPVQAVRHRTMQVVPYDDNKLVRVQ